MNYPYNPYLSNPYLSQQVMLPQQPVLQPVKGCCYTVAVENVDAGVGDALVDQQTISVADGNLVVARIA